MVCTYFARKSKKVKMPQKNRGFAPTYPPPPPTLTTRKAGFSQALAKKTPLRKTPPSPSPGFSCIWIKLLLSPKLHNKKSFLSHPPTPKKNAQKLKKTKKFLSFFLSFPPSHDAAERGCYFVLFWGRRPHQSHAGFALTFGKKSEKSCSGPKKTHLK